MRLRDAKEQVEREHPELTGTAKLEAIKALRGQAAAQQEVAAPADGARCANCDQQVKPVEKRGWAGFLAWLSLLEFGSVIAAIVAAFHPFSVDSMGSSIGRLILWPAAVHPVWLSIVAALAAFFITSSLAGSASRRATANATCPKCGLRLTSAASPTA